jgi:hypothetical protein
VPAVPRFSALSVVVGMVLAGSLPAAAECGPADPDQLLADSQASFVGTFVGQEAEVASFVVTEVVTGPLEQGALDAVVVGDPYQPSSEAAGYFLNRRGGDWIGDGCAVTEADTLLALRPGGGGLENPDSHPEEPPYSLFLIVIGVVVIGIYAGRWAQRRRG